MQDYHGDFLHCMVVAVTTMPNRTLSFQVIFTGFESDDDEDSPNVHGGAMWARTALVADAANCARCRYPFRGVAPRTSTLLSR